MKTKNTTNKNNNETNKNTKFKNKKMDKILDNYFNTHEGYFSCAEVQKETKVTRYHLEIYLKNHNIKKLPRNSNKKAEPAKLSDDSTKKLDKYFEDKKTFIKFTQITEDTGVYYRQVKEYLKAHPEITRSKAKPTELLNEYFAKNKESYSCKDAMKFANCTRQYVNYYMHINGIESNSLRNETLESFFSHRHQFKDFDNLSKTLNIPKAEIMTFLKENNITLKPYKAGYYETHPTKATIAKLTTLKQGFD